MNLAGLALSRPIATTMLWLAVVVAGVVCWLKLPISALPGRAKGWFAACCWPTGPRCISAKAVGMPCIPSSDLSLSAFRLMHRSRPLIRVDGGVLPPASSAAGSSGAKRSPGEAVRVGCTW